MSAGRLAGIVVACTIAIIVVIVRVMVPSMPIPGQPRSSSSDITPSGITTLVDQILVVPIGVENSRRLDFSIDKRGVLKGTIEVVNGESISYYLYKESAEAGWTEAKGDRVVRSSFEVRLDPGRYYLLIVAYRWHPGDPGEERIASVYLEFES